MATVLQIVDPDSLSTVLYDLNDPTGTNSALYGSVTTALLQDPDWGVPNTRATVAEDSAIPVARTTFAQQGLATVKLKLRITATSYDNITKGIGTLTNYLTQGCVFRWIPNGSSETRYIDIEPSDPSILLAGQEQAMYEATVLFDTPHGLELNLKRQPFMRGAALMPSQNVLANPTLIRDANADGLPEGWTSSGGTHSIDVATDSYKQTAAGSAQGINQSTAAASMAPGQVWSVSCEGRNDGANTVQIFFEFLSNVNAILATYSGTIPISTVFQRVSYTTAAAPASTDHGRVTIITQGGAATFRVRNVQLEQAAAPSYFRTGPQTVTVDPAATTGYVNILPIYNPGTAPAPALVKVTFPDASNTTTAVQVAMRSNEGIPGRYRLADWMNNTHYAQAEANGNNWTVTLGTDTSAVAGTNASGSGNNVARVTHSTATTTITRRITWTRTTNLDSLRGDFDIWVRVKGAAARKYRLQARWAFGSVSPLPNSTDEYLHDLSYASAFDWVLVKLGRMSVPTELDVTALATFKLELWTAQRSGAAANLDVDYIRFVPTESSISQMPAANVTTWRAQDLTSPVSNPGGGTAVTISTNGLLGLFDTTTDNAGSPTITDVGHHSTRFSLAAQNYTAALRTLKLNIRNTSASTDLVSKTVNVPSGAKWISATLEWDAAAATNYQAQVDDPSAIGSKFVAVRSTTDTFTPVFEQNTAMQCDPGSRPSRHAVEKLDSSGNVLMTLNSERVPYWVPPGLTLLYIEAWDPIAMNYNENKHLLTRTMTVQATIYPRWWV